MRVLRDDRLTLEPQVADHADAMHAVLVDPALYEHEGAPPPSAAWLRERFARLETRRSADGIERWLNWAIRLPDGAIAGYVQATVHASRRADVAYVLGSRWWHRGLATAAVRLMLAELATAYEVAMFTASLKRSNAPSRRLLDRLGFAVAAPGWRTACDAAPDELAMVRPAVPGGAIAADAAPPSDAGLVVRHEQRNDASAIRDVVRRAFADHPHGDGTEHAIVDRLRAAGAMTVGLVAVRDGAVIGHVAASPVTLAPPAPGWFGLGPVAVAPERQRAGAGIALVCRTLDLLCAAGAAGCVVLGDPRYYERFGFVAREGLVLPGVPPANFMAASFTEGRGSCSTRGTVSYHPAFESDA